jgi:hypothetical protein
VNRPPGPSHDRTTEIYYAPTRRQSALAEFEHAFAMPDVRIQKSA